MASTLSAIVVQAFVAIIALESVKAKEPFVPTSHDVENGTNVDVQPYHHASEVDIFYRYLNSLLLGNLTELNRRMSDDYDGQRNHNPIDDERQNIPEKRRRMFWQPFGYLPVGIHINGKKGRKGSLAGGNGFRMGGQVFRFG